MCSSDLALRPDLAIGLPFSVCYTVCAAGVALMRRRSNHSSGEVSITICRCLQTPRACGPASCATTTANSSDLCKAARSFENVRDASALHAALARRLRAFARTLANALCPKRRANVAPVGLRSRRLEIVRWTTSRHHWHSSGLGARTQSMTCRAGGRARHSRWRSGDRFIKNWTCVAPPGRAIG